MAPRRSGRSTAVATVAAPLRAAVYTRKSSDEGLDRDFTTLDNQRERGEAFIASQGWTSLAERYDDGGFSGRTAERPALKRLLANVESGLVDTIVVYKLERLTRNLVDFGRIHEFLERQGVALVSVTESINTTTPHGRMMVNILLSFAQYERELIGERTRDKLSASRKRGKFVGGHPVLGFDLVEGRLGVNKDEAEQVGEIFRLYLEARSIIAVVEELNRRDWTVKRWTARNGKVMGGGRFNRVTLHRMLTNQTYIGRVEFEGKVYDGEHEGIVSLKVFREVQRILAENHSTGGASHRNKHGALLRSLLRCSACNRAMTHAPVRRGNTVHRYYRCQGAMKNGTAACPSRPVSANKVESFVVNEIKRIGSDQALQEETFRQAGVQLQAKRRGLQLDGRRIADELAKARADVERLVATVSRLDGAAADAVAVELAKAQERVAALQTREAEVAADLDAAKAMDIDREAVAQALAEFDELWSVLLTLERERVLRLLIERVDYRADTGALQITWRMTGLGEFAADVAP